MAQTARIIVWIVQFFAKSGKHDKFKKSITNTSFRSTKIELLYHTARVTPAQGGEVHLLCTGCTGSYNRYAWVPCFLTQGLLTRTRYPLIFSLEVLLKGQSSMSTPPKDMFSCPGSGETWETWESHENHHPCWRRWCRRASWRNGFFVNTLPWPGLRICLGFCSETSFFSVVRFAKPPNDLFLLPVARDDLRMALAPEGIAAGSPTAPHCWRQAAGFADSHTWGRGERGVTTALWTQKSGSLECWW